MIAKSFYFCILNFLFIYMTKLLKKYSFFILLLTSSVSSGILYIERRKKMKITIQIKRIVITFQFRLNLKRRTRRSR
nr:MAG TPA: hypothetical protein [Caudoviricetes sp.]